MEKEILEDIKKWSQLVSRKAHHYCVRWSAWGGFLWLSGMFGFFTESENRDTEKALSALKATFRPEFINRIDDIVIFEKLKPKDLEAIAEMHLSKLKDRCENLGISLDFLPSAISLVAKEGTDELYGARPIRRAVTRLAEDPLSVALLDGSIKSADRIIADSDGEKIVFKKG